MKIKNRCFSTETTVFHFSRLYVQFHIPFVNPSLLSHKFGEEEIQYRRQNEH